MKTLIAVLTVTLLTVIRSYSTEDHPSDSVSPILSVSAYRHGVDGVVLPGHLFGSNVTGVILDLDQIGTDKMLRVRPKSTTEFNSINDGTRFKLHSDQTIEDIKNGTKERTVILIRESKSNPYRTVICYYVKYDNGSIGEKGAHLGDAKTQHSLTISKIKNDHEVLGLLSFTDDPNNLKLLNNSKPAMR